ncbi:Protein of unknown function DUF1376 [uncultured Caudovirales phage]|uniref:DUF1376 domain-containing protein n=1 Tax=uncultured Caudovirales phage TaxID=2100421 RepID=A0A6J5MZM5_9CAUD|nr:Protein of unknown function DUF1376 [uncultured Caudovirales phage]
MNYYPFHIGDYISHTSHLSDAEDLAYRRMIDLYYQTEEPFKDIAWVARRIKSTSEIVKLLLEEFFEFDSDVWRSKRADEEIAKYRLKADSARNANRIKTEKKSALITELKSELKSEQNHIVTNNQEPITNNQEPNINTITPEGVSDEVFKDFCKLRKGLKAPVTQTAINGLAKEGQKANLTLEQVMILCCQNGWRGFKAEWIKEKKTVEQRNSTVMSGLTRGIIGGNKDVRLLGK